jgi:hypothetical protein
VHVHLGVSDAEVRLVGLSGSVVGLSGSEVGLSGSVVGLSGSEVDLSGSVAVLCYVVPVQTNCDDSGSTLTVMVIVGSQGVEAAQLFA